MVIYGKNLEQLLNKIKVIDNRDGATNTELIDEDTERKRQEWFAKLRLARCRKTNAFGNKTCEDVYDYITREEYEYGLRQIVQISPEDRYQDKKQQWFFHESSYYMRGLGGYDGYGCYNGKCIPDCKYYNEEGRIEHDEVIQKYKEHNEPKLIEYHVDTRGNIVYHYPEETK